MTDRQWALIEPLLPVRDPRKGGRPLRYERRQVIDSILYVLGSGCSWRRMPHDLAPWDVAYRWFSTWTADGTWDRVHDTLRDRVREADGRDLQPSAAVLDSQSVKSSEGGEAIGYDAGKRVRGRKRHLLVDTCGLLLKAVVHSASLQDRHGAKRVLTGIRAVFPLVGMVWVDGGYVNVVDASLVGWAATTQQIEPVAVPRNADVKGFQVLPRRWVVERTLCAARRSAVFPENREELEGRFLGRAADLDPKGEGDNSMPVCPAAGSRCQGRCTGRTRAIWRKLDCLNPNLQSMQVPIHRKDVCNRCRVLRRSRTWPTHPSERGATPSEGVEGDEWGAYVALLRTAETNAGSSVGREPYDDGGLVVVAGVTTGQRGRESRPQGEGGQVIGHPRLGRYA